MIVKSATGASVTAMPVKFAPLIAGSVEGNLASGIVPVKFAAGICKSLGIDPVIFAAGKLVSDAPEPLKVVALRVPVTVAPELLVSNFLVPA